MNGDVGVGCIDEHAFEIFDMPADPVRLMTVRPRHDDVARVTLGQTGPFLVTEDVEIECIEGRKARGALEKDSFLNLRAPTRLKRLLGGPAVLGQRQIRAASAPGT